MPRSFSWPGLRRPAPATDLPTLLADDMDTSGGRNITAMTLWSWSQVYDAPMTNAVTPEAIPVINRLAGECIERFFDVLVRRGPSRALDRGFLKEDNVSEVAPWDTLLANNTAGTLPPAIPIFLAQGEKDPLVLPKITHGYMEKLCKGGSAVRMYLMPNAGHAFAGRDSASTAIGWIADRFAGTAVPNDLRCPLKAFKDIVPISEGRFFRKVPAACFQAAGIDLPSQPIGPIRKLRLWIAVGDLVDRRCGVSLTGRRRCGRGSWVDWGNWGSAGSRAPSRRSDGRPGCLCRSPWHRANCLCRTECLAGRCRRSGVRFEAGS